jgi:hypothetical protein
MENVAGFTIAFVFTIIGYVIMFTILLTQPPDYEDKQNRINFVFLCALGPIGFLILLISVVISRIKEYIED